MRIAQILLAGAAAALLAACAPQSTPQAGPTAAPDAGAATAAPAAPDAYPAPNASGAYPAPDASAAYPGGEPALDPSISMEPVVVPEPSSAEVGVVHGTLFRTVEGAERIPVAGYYIYLAPTITSTDGVEGMVQLNINTAPRAELNGLGQFVFTDVPPGRYGLMLDSGIKGGALLLNDPQDGGNFIIEITGGDTQDLGELAYPFPEL